MPITKYSSEDKREIKIHVEERFDFSLHQKFRDSYSKCDVNNTTFILDLSKTSYMDSSALGMILLLKDHAESLAGEVIILHPSESVLKILQIAQFHRLFTIET